MYRAVHSDRSGRVYVSADWGACGFDGARTHALEQLLPLPAGARLVPLAREAEGSDRLGRIRRLGASRWALGAVLPPGFTRTLHPSYVESDPHEAPLAALATAAVGADEHGSLFVAALEQPRSAAGERDGEVKAEPIKIAVPAGNPVLRQIARCARENDCAGARGGQRGIGLAALPIAAASNESPPAGIAPAVRPDATVREPAAFKPSAEQLAELALAHLAAGGAGVSFGRACEGEPLLAVRLIEDAVGRIRAARADARIHLETNGSSASALRRLVAAGVSEVSVRLASARSDTYDAVHGPVGFRFPEVRSAVSSAVAAGARVTLAILVLPGLTDRPEELDALASLAGEAHDVRSRDLAADARRALALVPRNGAPLGVPAAVARLLDR